MSNRSLSQATSTCHQSPWSCVRRTVPSVPTGIGSGSIGIDTSRIRSPVFSGWFMFGFGIRASSGLNKRTIPINQPGNSQVIKPTCRHVWQVFSKHLSAPASRTNATCRVGEELRQTIRPTRKRPHVANAGRFVRSLADALVKERYNPLGTSIAAPFPVTAIDSPFAVRA